MTALAVIGSSLSAELVAAVAAARSGRPVSLCGTRRVPADISVTGFGWDGRGTVRSSEEVDPEPSTYVYLGAARDWLPFVSENAAHLGGKVLLVMGGGVGAAAAAVAALDGALGPGHRTVVAEVQSFPFLGASDAGRYAVTGVKRGMGIASPRSEDAGVAQSAVSDWLEDLELRPYPDVTFADVNPLIHPTICVANARAIDRGERFGLFTEGLSPAVGDLIGAMERERDHVLGEAGIAAKGVLDTLGGFYADQGWPEAGLSESLASFGPYETAVGPPGFDHRYVVDDVAFGLDPLARLARSVDVAVPVIDGVIGLCRSLTGFPLSGAGRWDVLAPMLAAERSPHP